MSIDLVRDEFYVAGGALQRSARCYVSRPADRQLYEGLSQGEFCFVLTPRQMGKSSLMVRTAQRLQEAGVTVVVLDLTAVGQNLDLEKWYSGLLAVIGQQLDLDDELDDFWWGHERLGPLQRWMAAIRQVVLPRCSKLTIFVDEIDVVRSLPFSTDEFFAAIRSCHNRRSEDSALDHLTFCLLGVATPSDLIRDTRMTPFNIGRRIELEDFSEQDAAVLQEGLAEGVQVARNLLRRVLYWTGGHPYLTQRLCRAVTKDARASEPADVDRICEEVFLSRAARQQDSNLIFVRERILRSGGDLAALLEEYRRLYRRRRVRKDERNPIHNKLQLAGVTRTEGSVLTVRNRIYQHVFDLEWIKASMPDAELRRQRAAFRRGLLRASLVASVFILILAASASMAVYQWQAADRERHNAEGARAKAEAAAGTARRALGQAQQAQQEAEVARDEAQRQRERAETARVLEQRQREEAEVQRAAAIAAQEKLQIALADTETARQAAENAQKRAEREKLIAEQNAETARRRGRLFEKLLPLLQEHASEGVLQYARQLQDQGKPLDAIAAFVELCELAIGEEQGFLARELLQLDPIDLEGLAAETTGVAISIPRQSLFTNAVLPGIDLGETELARRPDPQMGQLLAKLYTYRARVLKQDAQQAAPGAPTAEEMIFESYDRAAALEPQQYEHYLGRAAARFRRPDRDLSKVLEDLETAARLYPDPPAPAGDAQSVTDAHRELAQIHHARANVLEFLAESAPSDRRIELYGQAEQCHRQAQAMDPANAHYLVGIARSIRERAVASAAGQPSQEDLRTVRDLLDSALAKDAHSHIACNELGELYLAEGNITRARKEFGRAIEYGQAAAKRSRYTYLCNLANACTWEPANAADYGQALEAAEGAMALGVDHPVDAHYYQALAMWKLGRMEPALAALANVFQLDPDHVEGLLAQCQIVFEMKDPAPTESQVKQAYTDMRRVLDNPQLSRDQRAKAHYVNSLAWLRYHVQQKSESALVKCQDFALKAATGSRAYLGYAKQVFQHAAERPWQDANLKSQSQQLEQQFQQVSAANPSPGGN